MKELYIVGVGMIRFGKFPHLGVKAMASQATELALQDAGMDRSELEAAYFSNSFWGFFSNQHAIRGQVVLRNMGIEAIPVVNVENACAGASTALYQACQGIRAGSFEVALALGAEKTTHLDKKKSLEAYSYAVDVENYDAHLEMMARLNQGFNLAPSQQNSGFGKNRSIFMDVYAMFTRWHMNRFGSTQRQLAVIAAKNHLHASLNPLAQYQKAMSAEEVLADVPVTYPLTRSMCAPVGDGAAAAIVCSGSYLKRLEAVRPVKIRAAVLGSGTDRDLDGLDIGERLAGKAYQMAGLGPEDIDLAELHDATAYGELHQTEAMGFCPPGNGGHYAESGATRLGGEKPINTSGGLECRGHPVGASGLAQIYELVTQLRGEAGPRQVPGARFALAENGGGTIGVEEAAMCIHILEKGPKFSCNTRANL